MRKGTRTKHPRGIPPSEEAVFLKWQDILRLKEEYRCLLKQRSMIFQVEAKEQAAGLCRLPHAVFYRLSYDAWSKLSKQLYEFQEKALAEYHRYMQRILEFKKLPGKGKVTLGQIWCAYRDFCLRAGKPTILDKVMHHYLLEKPSPGK